MTQWKKMLFLASPGNLHHQKPRSLNKLRLPTIFIMSMEEGKVNSIRKECMNKCTKKYGKVTSRKFVCGKEGIQSTDNQDLKTKKLCAETRYRIWVWSTNGYLHLIKRAANMWWLNLLMGIITNFISKQLYTWMAHCLYFVF